MHHEVRGDRAKGKQLVLSREHPRLPAGGQAADVAEGSSARKRSARVGSPDQQGGTTGHREPRRARRGHRAACGGGGRPWSRSHSSSGGCRTQSRRGGAGRQMLGRGRGLRLVRPRTRGLEHSLSNTHGAASVTCQLWRKVCPPARVRRGLQG